MHAYVCAIPRMPSDPSTCDLLCLDLPKAERLRGGLPEPHDLEQLAAAFKALGDPTRLAIALALRDTDEACVCDLGWVVGRDEKLVSHHVRLLKASGLAASERRGKMVMYRLTSEGRGLLRRVEAGARA